LQQSNPRWVAECSVYLPHQQRFPFERGLPPPWARTAFI